MIALIGGKSGEADAMIEQGNAGELNFFQR